MSYDVTERGTLALMGNPANECIVVFGRDGWRHIDSGRLIQAEDFRAGFEILYLPATKPKEKPDTFPLRKGHW